MSDSVESVRIMTGLVLLTTGAGCLVLSMIGLSHHRGKFQGAAEEFLDDFALGGVLGFFKGVIHGYRESLRDNNSDTFHLAVLATVGILLFASGIALVAV